jgi:putative phage-type endonuclease
MQQRTPEWFVARRGKLTASRLAAAAGICPFMSRPKYMDELRTEPAFLSNAATRWGTVQEHNAVRDYAALTGNLVTKYGFKLHEHYPWIGGSPDGLVGTRGMIEVKCPFYKLEPHKRVPAYYLCQVNALMEIFDRDWCDYVSWTPTAMRIYRVYRDPGLWDFLLDRYTMFHACMLRGATMPNQASGERRATLERLADADDESVDYEFHADRHTWEPPPDAELSVDCPDWVKGAGKRAMQYWWQYPSAKRMPDQSSLDNYFCHECSDAGPVPASV